ncbi:MAG TPA: kelch repeat-containing protein [Candidatus Sulfotelmatobacter sp.]|nr:kelch repeat-containing protein [Candidatus Sulfotelmatobacter sp.]
MRGWGVLSWNLVVSLFLLLALASFSNAQTWTQYGPPARFSHSGVFDPTTKGIIVFGGQNSSSRINLNDLWLVTTSSLKYISATQLTASGPVPSARYGHVASYDSATNRMTIFGGGTGAPSPCLNDVWILDGANGKSGAPTWLSTAPSGKLPAPRYHHTGVYDFSTNSMIVFGGSNCSKGYFNDVWVLSNANGETGTPNWKQLFPTGTAPNARESASAVYDPVNNIMIVYGGDAGTSVDFGDVWVLSNANGTGGTPAWTQLAPMGAAPMARTGMSAIYDSVNNRMTIFGGFHSVRTLNDSFVLTNANGTGGTPAWIKIAAKGTAPSVGYQSAVYDTTKNAMYVFAGSSSDAKLAGDDHGFTLTNANGIGTSSWTRGGPPARYSQSMFYDSVTNSVFVLDGQHAMTNTNFDDYWQTNNITTSSNLDWIPINVGGTHPHSRWGQSAAYDFANNRLMMFAGATGFPAPCMNDYWVMTYANNTGKKPTWISVPTAGTTPPIRTRHSAAYDPATDTLIVFGGFNCTAGYYNDVWVLSHANNLGGTPTWTQLSPAGAAPSPRQSTSAIYNSGTNTLTVFGGDAGGAPFGDTWVLSSANGSGGTPTWTEITPSNNGPSARSGHTAAYDAQNDLMMIYGGFDGTSLLNDTWVLSAASGQGTSTWTELTPSTAGPGRRFASATYDPATNLMNVFGGVFTLPSLPDDHLFSFTNANGIQ